MDLSIIILNFNTKRLTGQCLKTIKTSKDKLKKEVIVIDNGSSDNSVDYIKKHFSWVKLISSKNNLGFTKGNNLGVAKAKGKYIWLLNSDTLLQSSTINTLMKEVVKNNSLIASCKLLNKDGTVQPQGGYLPSLKRIFYWMLFIDDLPLINKLIKPYQQRSVVYFKQNQHPDWLSGTALLIEKSFYRHLKGLDENLFMYGEDVEFCLRAQQQTIKLFYFAEPTLTHLGHASGCSQNAVLGEYQGLKYIYTKHYSNFNYLLLRLLLKIGALLRIIIFGIILSDEKRKETYVKAFKLA